MEALLFILVVIFAFLLVALLFTDAYTAATDQKRLLHYLMESPTMFYSSRYLEQALQIPAARLFPALMRLERLGMVRSEWEILPPEYGRRPRRLYALGPEANARLYAQSANPSEARP